MPNNVLISIIVPVYNASNTLSQCIESLITQSYNNIEIILVDDGSTDSSYEICKMHEESDFRIRAFHKTNGGVSSARNFGINVSKGDYLLFCDSDDWIEEDTCEVFLKNHKHGNLEIYSYYCHYLDGSTSICSYGDYDSFYWDKGDFFLLQQIGGFNPWNKLFEAEIVKTYNICFPENLSMGEDKMFVWRYVKHISGCINYINDPKNHYRWPNSSSLTNNIDKNYYLQIMQIVKEVQYGLHVGEIDIGHNALVQFSNDSFYQFVRAINQILDDEMIDSQQKKRICNEILDSDEFCFIKEKINVKINKFVLWCLINKHYYLIKILYKIGKL